MITASTSLTIFIMNIHFCGAEAKPVPYWAKVLIIDYMSKIFFVYEVGESCASPFGQTEDSEPFLQNHKQNLKKKLKGAPPPCCPDDDKSAAFRLTFDPCVYCSCHGKGGILGCDPKLIWNVEYIANCFREQKATCLKVAEWKKIAKVMDRFFMWIFFIMVFLMSILIIGKAP